MRTRPPVRGRLAALLVALLTLAALIPAGSAIAAEQVSQRYIVVYNGQYALDGSYALGAGYALSPAYALGTQYALDGLYALHAAGSDYALYALDSDYALASGYALDQTYALSKDYALPDTYALRDGYALADGYALYALYALNDVYALLGDYALDATYALTGQDGSTADYALYALGDNYALARDYALSLVASAGGTVVADLTAQLGVMIVDSKSSTFAQVMSGYALVSSVGYDFGWQQFPTLTQAVGSGQLSLVAAPDAPTLGGSDPLTAAQWDMRQLHTAQAQQVNSGSPNVSVGIVDTGIDGNHLDFVSSNGSNVDCARGADFTTDGPGIGNPLACVDNNFHGTHVAGIIAARANGRGTVGVAPNVTLVPIKVCDASGSCYASDVVRGITYAGDLGLNVINMSFYVDDDTFNSSTEFKCKSDPTQYAFRQAVQRAITYARTKGVTPIAAAGNDSTNLDLTAKGCEVVPAQSDGVLAVSAIGPESGKAGYSNYGKVIGVAVPGGDYVADRDSLAGQTICDREVLSTIPGNLYGCFQGTSMAAPHAVGIAALIISQFGQWKNGRWWMDPSSVIGRLEHSAIDIGVKGRDACYGYGRADALRAVTQSDSPLYDSAAPAWTACP